MNIYIYIHIYQVCLFPKVGPYAERKIGTDDIKNYPPTSPPMENYLYLLLKYHCVLGYYYKKKSEVSISVYGHTVT